MCVTSDHEGNCLVQILLSTVQQHEECTAKSRWDGEGENKIVCNVFLVGLRDIVWVHVYAGQVNMC